MQKFTTHDGLELAYWDEGEGLPVLCLSGLTRTAADFDFVAPHLSDVRLIRMDYRGRGQSDWADDFNTYSVPTEARDAIALLDHLGIKKAAVIGTSRGGLIAMMLAATAKDRLSGVLLNDIGPELTDDGLAVIMDYIGRNPKFKTRAEMAAAMPELMTGFADVPAKRWQDNVERHTLEAPDGLTINYDPKLRDAMWALADKPTPDLWPLFDALAGLPLALLRGANSDLLSREAAAKMQKRNPDMLFAEVPNRAHIPFLDEPESLSLIRQWLGKIV